MANEIQMIVSLGINNISSTPPGNIQFQNRGTGVRASMAGNNGPCIGTVLISTHGTSPDFSELTLFGGMCLLTNLDPANFVSFGIFDTLTGKFHKLGEMLPGESYLLRTSRDLGSPTGTGSGTGSGFNPPGNGPDQFHLQADISPCRVTIQAFDP